MEDNNSDQIWRTVTHADEIESERLNICYQIWKSNAEKGQGFDPLSFTQHLPYAAYGRYSPKDDAFEISYVGHGLQDWVGVSKEQLEEEMAANTQFYRNNEVIFRAAYEAGNAILNGPRNVPLPNREFLKFQSLTMPFPEKSGDEVTIMTIIDLFQD